ncbi:MAG: SGNH/GDSL hydrolase family protein [Oligoflexales bacterium]|nr:SGNH/GDSL hydrolase family protein [Oligoflexales bacterium]
MNLSNAKISRLFIIALLFRQVAPTHTFAETSNKQWKEFAILGDSLATGAASHPALSYDANKLMDVFLGKTDVSALSANLKQAALFGIDPVQESLLAAPHIIWPQDSEFRMGPAWVFQHLMFGLSFNYLNRAEYSYAYLLARSYGVAAENIFIAAENGNRTRQLTQQAKRLLADRKGQLPDVVMVNFAGNDLCAANYDLLEYQSQAYSAELESGLVTLIRAASAAKATTILLPAFLRTTQLLHVAELLAKPVEAFSKATTCEQLYKSYFQAPADYTYLVDEKNPLSMLSRLLPPNPVSMCPTLFLAHQDLEVRLSLLANKIRSFRQQQKQVVDKLNQEIREGKFGTKKLSIKYLASTEELTFSADEIAVDCFHLSLSGHEKLALTLKQNIDQLQTIELKGTAL